MFTADEAVARTEKGDSVILVRRETSPEDIHGMHAAAGILTSTGGSTSHAAVVARGWGKCCVAGAGDLIIDARRHIIKIGERKISVNDVISIDGSSGEVMLGDVPRQAPSFTSEFRTLMTWADKTRNMVIRTNADTPEDSKIARDFGAEGIGLCRTEHMFFDADRIADRSQYTDPHHYSEGVVHVWVGGTAVLRAEEMTGARPGRFLERGRR